MKTADQHIQDMVQRITQRWISRQTLLVCALVGGSFVLWLMLMIVADNWLMLRSRDFLAGWAAMLSIVIALAAWTIFTLTRGRPNATGMAQMYERAQPGQGNRLVNSVQLLASGRADREPAAWAVIAENAPLLDLRTAAQAVDHTIVKRVTMAGAVLLLVLAGYSAAQPKAAINAISRLLQPFSPPPHLLATDIAVTPGDTELLEGQSLAIQANLSRNLPGNASLEYRVGNLPWTRESMTALDKATFRYANFAAVTHPITYRIVAGRSVSRDYLAKVKLRPSVEELLVSVTPPEYVGQPARQLKPNVGDVTALAGSTVQIRLRASALIGAGNLELSDGKNAKILPDTLDAHRAMASFVLSNSGSYAIGLSDSQGLSNLNPPRYSLTAQDDQPPTVMISQPGRDLILPPQTALPLTIEGQDDYGLGAVIVQMRVGKSDWADVQKWEMAEKNMRRKTIAFSLPLEKLALKTGDIVMYRAVAMDRKVPQANTGTSRSWSVTISDATNQALQAANAKKLLDGIQKILAMQRENRAAVDMDLPIAPIQQRQNQIRDMTTSVIDQERKAVRPLQSVVDDLTELADGLMIQANKLVMSYQGTYEQRIPFKPPIIKVMDQIIAKLQAIADRLSKSLATADTVQKAVEELSPADREQSLQKIRAMLEKLHKFVPEQSKVIDDTEELVRKGENLTEAELQKLDKTRGTEDQWAKVFTASVADINKLTEQLSDDKRMINDFKQMVEQIEAAALNLHPKQITIAVPREQSGREMAEKLAEDMEMWLPNTPDNIKWVMEEPLDRPTIPMPELPDQLKDLIGDLIEQAEELNEEADDITSSWADSISAAGWGVGDGPISNFSAKGVTGNQLPNNSEMSGRAGDGRGGKSQGQMVGDTAKGLDGRKLPTRITNDPYEQGVVKELQQTATGGATGGGKARGAGQEGLQGQAPPPQFKDMQYMKDWQQKLRQQAEKIAGQAKAVRVQTPELDKSIELMKQAEQAGKDGRYGDMFKKQQMVLSTLKMAGDAQTRDVALRVDQAQKLPEDQKKQMLDAMDEPMPQEFEGAVRRYFMQLSQDK